MSHNCGKYHFGNQSIARDCCIAHARELRAMALRNAMTTYHPAYRGFVDSWNSLTDAERVQVRDIRESMSGGFEPMPDANRPIGDLLDNDDSGFWLACGAERVIRCDYVPTYGRGWQGKRVTYPNGAIQVRLGNGWTQKVDSLDAAKAVVRSHAGA